MTAKNQTGQSGSEVPPKPKFFEYIHELERDKASHDPPAIVSTTDLANVAETGGKRTSTRKRARREFVLSIEEKDERDAKRHAELMEQFRASNQHKEAIVNVMRYIANKFE